MRAKTDKYLISLPRKTNKRLLSEGAARVTRLEIRIYTEADLQKELFKSYETSEKFT